MSELTRQLSAEERVAWLRLTRSENVGPITFYELLRRFGTAEAALDALPDLARRGGRSRPLKLFGKSEAETEIAAAQRFGAQLVARCEPDYPPLLRPLDDAPPILTFSGHIHLAQRPTIGIVGARNASAVGLKLARQLGGELGRLGFTVVSGLARGVDTAAHNGALATGTIAVIAGGIDNIYPPENRDLFAALRETGLIFAEQPFAVEPQGRHFPRRNRLISGLSRGVVIVEAALKSGSLITARFAADQGRDVMAIPGSPLDPRARGTNDLIRNGATLVENAEDIVRALQHWNGFSDPPVGHPPSFSPTDVDINETMLEPLRQRIGGLLTYAPIEIDELIRLSGASPGAVLSVLLELELAGRLRRLPGAQVSLESS